MKGLVDGNETTIFWSNQSFCKKYLLITTHLQQPEAGRPAGNSAPTSVPLVPIE
jgi:hypothetical protein